MPVEVIHGISDKPAASDELTRLLSAQQNLSGYLYIGYPFIGTATGLQPIDALWISEDKGIVIFDLIEGNTIENYDLRQDDLINKLEARLKVHSDLTRRRELLISIHVLSFAPGVTNFNALPDYQLTNRDSLLQELDSLNWEGKREGIYSKALSVIQSVSTIRQSKTNRIIQNDSSRGARLQQLEDSIATLDKMQSKAVIETVDGVQRIRGLAGSGKTIVLARKAAYLHAQHPDWRIAVTFNTRSLKDYFKRQIAIFSLEQTGTEPDWDNLRIINAWGAPGGPERDGIYYEFCRVHGIEYFDFRTARRRFGTTSPFAKVCETAIGQVKENRPVYDALLIDEAQDFAPAFLRLCHALLGRPKRLVYAYDELQNLSRESLPSPEEIFGVQPSLETTAGIGPSRDIILEKCYRNSRPVLVTAHALGFGIYRKPPRQMSTGLIQMFDNAQLWTEVGYRIKGGELVDGKHVELERSAETSPVFLENHSDPEDLIQFLTFDNEEQQSDWLVSAIKKNLDEDEMKYNDIVVINPDPITTRSNVGLSRRKLFELNIKSHLAGVDTDPDTFFRSDEESITFTGIFRAKGNEAGMVYIVNAQDCHSSSWNLATIRNQLFTSITRSKAWVRVLGIGDKMRLLSEEYGELKAHNFELSFLYPDLKEREQLRLVHRDMTEAERRRLRSRRQSLASLVKDLETGEIVVQDLDEEMIARLREYLA